MTASNTQARRLLQAIVFATSLLAVLRGAVEAQGEGAYQVAGDAGQTYDVVDGATPIVTTAPRRPSFPTAGRPANMF